LNRVLKDSKDFFSFPIQYDWFAEDFAKGTFKYSKIKRQTEIDQSYYAGHFKVDLLAKDVRSELKPGRVVLLKHYFFPCIFLKIKKSMCKILIQGKTHLIPMADILLIRTPFFTKEK
jgi:hypothetical protein